MSYRINEVPYTGVVCGLCKDRPKEPYGILSWMFDTNLISCLECRRQPVSQKEINKEIKTQEVNWWRRLFHFLSIIKG